MSDTQPSSPQPLGNAGVWLLTIAAGATVANNYYNQAYLSQLVAEFGLTAGSVALVPVLSQLGNTIGILFLAPLGDRMERKSLILATMAALIAALCFAASAGTLPALAGTSFAVGLFATVTQQIVPLGVHLAAPAERGRTLGRITSGILVGILLARMASGVISELWGWRSVLALAAGLMGLIGAALALWLPRVPASTSISYRALTLSLWEIWCRHPVLRRGVKMQMLVFAAFMAFWSNVALRLAEPEFGYDGTAVGLLALIGIVGALAAPVAGAFADRRGGAAVISVGAGLCTVAFAIFAAVPGVIGLVVGVVVIDMGVQVSQVANQARVYALDASAKSRLNTIFMAGMIAGGALGAGCGGLAYAAFGWLGTCVFGFAAAAAALLLSRQA